MELLIGLQLAAADSHLELQIIEQSLVDVSSKEDGVVGSIRLGQSDLCLWNVVLIFINFDSGQTSVGERNIARRKVSFVSF